MKKLPTITNLTIALLCASLTSCGLVTSALKVPGSIIKTVGRTAGMPVNQAAKTSPDQAPVEVVGDGVIETLD